ncbi:competence type IV pilus minor pilin ComGD [Jeotgalibacillus sp. ET6]|uniref:competence type IV pilus minor pilin ComGD n=1 Tax=Jeotgalibacillus sp. ET6 TaxID=3037260 RepID=UPI002418968B|nr:competence type IV pilus minor pilin ComGD [Jeotgalibacillus sp. ET6]MDG5470792.1 competence type IV pilus minor pilin ComGD [Jeotgalibacillus sp. ET6]
MKLHNRGFTMVELMVVLLLMTVLISVCGSLAYKSIQVKEEKLFKEQLSEDLHDAQLTALTSGEYVSLYFYPHSSYYFILKGSGAQAKYLAKRDLPDSIKILDTTTLPAFKFLPSGSTDTFGAIRFSINGDPYSVHYFLGKGRFYIAQGR